ncbi:MAG: 1-acyl-sn-glycerol-3-phosphate acyltransferase [Candidatus Bipolaricaulota bacterium]|nr:1-acyl-sn-glycerol-3-phosphate acyltransferase [Candidatus Bipolaricaulota bacterium]MBS3792494.1 1-acyl-sn-glycerol-3-phosphate acyltransferase [Candidatus Bipolaricaulota bacterium]
MSWLLYNLIGLFFRLGIKPYFDLQVDGLDNYSESPSSLVVANHKRDLDSVLIASILYYHNGFLPPSTPISFMADENLFQPGFLGNWIKGPRLLKKALQPLSLSYILRKLHAHPIGKLDFHSVPVHDALRIIKENDDDHELREIIKEEALEDLLEESSFGSHEMTISEFFEREGYPRKKINSRNFKPEFRKAVKKSKLSAVKGQLGKFIQLLNEGAILYITPEGTLTQNGMLGPLKDSLLILIDEADSEVTVVPTNITYDFTNTGKARIFVNLGEEIRGLEELDRKERSTRLRKTILGLTTINLGQLGSYRLKSAKEEGRDKVKLDEFHERVMKDLEYFERKGYNLDDKLSDREGVEQRWRSFIDYCLERGILEKEGDVNRKEEEVLTLSPDLGYDRTEIPRGYRRDPVNYCANEIIALEKVGLINL